MILVANKADLETERVVSDTSHVCHMTCLFHADRLLSSFATGVICRGGRVNTTVEGMEVSVLSVDGLDVQFVTLP